MRDKRVVSLLLWVPMLLTGTRAESNRFDLTIREYNLARIREAELAGAHKEVHRIFEQIGIEIRWERGGSTDPEARHVDLSARDLSLAKLRAPDRINLIILSDKQTRFAGNHLATSLPFSRIVRATIFSDNVHRTGVEFQIPPEPLLGYVIAHEITHVLLRSNGHSLGIMRANWLVGDYDQIRRDALDFTAADKAALRDAVEDR